MGGCAMIGQSMINVKSGGRGRLSTLSAGVGDSNEPRNPTVATGLIAVAFVLSGNVDFGGVPFKANLLV